MSNEAQTEALLKAHHSFPCRFSFKVIGDHTPALAHDVERAIAEVTLAASEWTQRESAGGRHLALTFRVQVADARDVMAIYRRLRAVEGVRMVL